MIDKNNNKKEEEIDLGSLFLIIGKGFSNLFNFIGSIFRGVFDFFIQILLFLKSNFRKIGTTTLLGSLLGLIWYLNTEQLYESNLQVEPHFNSTRQLYNNVNYYNDLILQKDYIRLSKIFNLSVSEAKSLKGIKVEPIINKNDIFESYRSLIKTLDSVSISRFSLKNFENNFTDYDYKIHNIRVKATENTIFSKLGIPIILSVTENNYFEKIKKNNTNYLNRTDLLIRKNLVHADSLFYVYKQVMLKEAEKTSSGTSINLGNSQTSKKELELFGTIKKLSEDLKDISNDISKKSEIVNVISDFKPVGHKIKDIKNNKIFQCAVIGFFVAVIWILLIKLNKYLDNYKK